MACCKPAPVLRAGPRSIELSIFKAAGWSEAGEVVDQ